MSALSISRGTRRLVTGTLLVAALAASALPRASHAAPSPVALRTLTITASHPAFPAHLPAGLLALHVVADGPSSFDVGVARPNPGVSMAQAEAASAHRGFMQLMRLLTFLGGLGVPAHGRGTVVLDLRTPGSYGLHVTRGDQDPGHDLHFTVTPAATAPETLPPATVHVTLRGTHFVGLPATLRAGPTTFTVTGAGPGVRDLLLYRLDRGKTVRDMIAAAKVDEQTGRDPAWAHEAAAVDVLSPHQTVWVRMTLTPGTYVALCPLPDLQHHGQALMFEGMIVSLTVV